jgi:hypothetical protein
LDLRRQAGKVAQFPGDIDGLFSTQTSTVLKGDIAFRIKEPEGILLFRPFIL